MVRKRLAHGVGLGDGEVADLSQAIRVHGNAVEYIPMALILMALLEFNGAPAQILHILGSGLIAARVLHAWGLSTRKGQSMGRFYGTLFTWIVILSASVLNLAF